MENLNYDTNLFKEEEYIAVIDLIKSLLVPESNHRLGENYEGTISILAHDFFIGLDIEMISNFSLSSPLILHENPNNHKKTYKELLGLPKLENYHSKDQLIFKHFSDCLHGNSKSAC